MSHLVGEGPLGSLSGLHAPEGLLFDLLFVCSVCVCVCALYNNMSVCARIRVCACACGM